MTIQTAGLRHSRQGQSAAAPPVRCSEDRFAAKRQPRSWPEKLFSGTYTSSWPALSARGLSGRLVPGPMGPVLWKEAFGLHIEGENQDLKSYSTEQRGTVLPNGNTLSRQHNRVSTIPREYHRGGKDPLHIRFRSALCGDIAGSWRECREYGEEMIRTETAARILTLNWQNHRRH